jgi:ubiquinone/menaquinone biosynthesis C-methylase UbiE
MSLLQYAQRYKFDGDLSEAIDFVGANGDFELKSQRDFMIAHGLKPDQTFLDLGCGCLRGTAYLVDYLNDGNFFGADVSKSLIAMAPARLDALGVSNKPTLVPIENFNLPAVFKTQFDFILSVSLLTHVLPADIPSLFRGVAGVLEPTGTWFFTMYPSYNTDFYGDIECMYYNKEWLIAKGKQCGLIIEDIPGDFLNPAPMPHIIERVNSTLGQWVMKARLA